MCLPARRDMSWPSPRVFPGDDLVDIEFAKADSLSFCLNMDSSSSVPTQWRHNRCPRGTRAKARLTDPIFQPFVFALGSITARKDRIFYCQESATHHGRASGDRYGHQGTKGRRY